MEYTTLIGRPGPGFRFSPVTGIAYFVELGVGIASQNENSIVRNFSDSTHVFHVPNGTEYYCRLMEYSFSEQSYGWSTSFTGTWRINLTNEVAVIFQDDYPIHQGTIECLGPNNNTGAATRHAVVHDVIQAGGSGICKSVNGWIDPPASRNLCRFERNSKFIVWFPGIQAVTNICDNPNIVSVQEII